MASTSTSEPEMTSAPEKTQQQPHIHIHPAPHKDELLHRLLVGTDSNHFHVEYNEYYANHASHAIVALRRLGASDERLTEFLDKYILTSRLLPPQVSSSDNRLSIQSFETDLIPLLGKREHFPEISAFFRSEYARLSGHEGGSAVAASELVRLYFPRLMEGLSGSALHPLISIGYGLEAGEDTVVVDGLSYMAFAYRSMGHIDPLCLNIQNDLEQQEKDGTPFITAKQILDLCEGLRSSKIFERSGDIYKAAANPLETPEYLRAPKGEGSEQDDLFLFKGEFQRRMVLTSRLPEFKALVKEQLYPLLRNARESNIDATLVEIVRGALFVYSAAVIDDFFLLHGVTSGWALTRLWPLFSSSASLSNEAGMTWRWWGFEQKLLSAGYFLLSLLGVYICQGLPPLTIAPSPSLIQELSALKPSPWQKVINTAIASDEEHDAKLVYNCRDFLDEHRRLQEQGKGHAPSGNEARDSEDFYLFVAAQKMKLSEAKREDSSEPTVYSGFL